MPGCFGTGLGTWVRHAILTNEGKHNKQEYDGSQSKIGHDVEVLIFMVLHPEKRLLDSKKLEYMRP